MCAKSRNPSPHPKFIKKGGDSQVIYVGIDIHKEKCVASFVDVGTGSIWVVHFFATKPSIEAFARNHLGKDMVVGLEATSNTWFVATLLNKYVDKVIMVAPQKHRSRIKTDERDAQQIALSLAQRTYKACWTPTFSIYILRQLLGYWMNLQKGINILKNRLRATLMANGIALSQLTPFSKRGREEIEKKLKTLPRFIAWEISSLLKRLDTAESEKCQLESLLADIAKDEPLVHLLITIPGISFVSALFILSEIGDINRFGSPKKLVNYAGLCPSLYQSGERSYGGGITKVGRKRLRWILVQAANNAIRVEGRIRKFYLRLRDKKHHNVAVVACARKMLVIIWHMLKSGEIYKDCVERLYKKKARIMESETKEVPTVSLTHLISQLSDFLNREEADDLTSEAELREEVVKIS